MPAAQQNQMIQKYCAVCHTDASRNGGLSLQHFDAAHVNPADAALVLSKVENTALGAAGIPVPDRPTQDALIAALTAESAGANNWIVERSSSAPLIVASIVQGIPSTRKGSRSAISSITKQ
jgi:cytochrome c551/c552